MSTRRRPSGTVLASGLLAIVVLWAAGYQRTMTALTRPLEAGRGTPSGADENIYAIRYRDGTYKGWGRRRHGGVEATVAIKRGKIAKVDITLCDTRYPCTYIAPLPPQAVARNTADVDAISGATESSEAFSKAVADALKKAERPRRQR